jgi:Leucine-rich repeat (LRR) protein
MVFQLDISNNELCGLDMDKWGTYTAEGTTAIADALRVNGALTSVDLSGNHLTDSGRDMTGIKELAVALGVNGALTKLSLADNELEEEGTKAICEALERNTTLKELDISGRLLSNIGGSAGAKNVAKMLGVNGGLTVANLLGNQLDAESAKMLAEIAKQKGISLCGIRRDQTTANFHFRQLKLPDAILLASDLSQAVVTGGLTSLNLSSNTFCSVTATAFVKASQVQGSSFNEGDKVVYQGKEMIVSRAKDRDGRIGMTDLPDMSGLNALADAFHVNGTLTALDLSFNNLKDEGVTAVCEAIQSNKETKLVSLNFGNNGIGPVGANAVAAMVAVTGGLTKIE